MDGALTWRCCHAAPQTTQETQGDSSRYSEGVLPLVPFIINGDSASSRDYPMTGAVILETDDADAPLLWCSSTLLVPDTVVLAAHCVDPELITALYPGTTEIRLFWSRLDNMTPYDGTGLLPHDAVEVIGAVYHADYSVLAFDEGIADNHDIALLFLEEAQDIAHAYPISPAETAQLVEGAGVVVVGWGQQSAEDPDDIGEKRMGDSVIGEVGSAEFLVGPEASDVRQCHGDSGGPVFLDVDADTETPTRIVGVTSHAYDETACASTGAVNTRIDAHLGWLDAQLRARCEDGFRVWCEEPGLIFAPVAEEDDSDGSIGDGLGPGASTGSGRPTELTTDTAGCSTVSGPMLWWLPVLLGRRRRPSRPQPGSANEGSCAAQP